MAFVCSYCVEEVFSAPSEVLLLHHIRLVHSCDPNFSIKCLSEQCSRTFTNFRTFQNHLRTCPCHVDLSPEPSVVNEDPDTESHYSGVQDYLTDSIPSFSASDLQSYSAKWILKTSETHSLSRTATLGIVHDVTDLVDFLTQMLEKKTHSILQQSEVDDSVIQQVGNLFSGFLVRPFERLETFHQQLQYYRDHLGLIVSLLK